jgi:general secretion pathway protein D
VKTAICVFVLMLSVPRIFAGTIVDAVGPVTNPEVGDTFTVDIDVSGIADLYAFQFDLSFDPALLSAVSVVEGPFLQSGGTTFFIPGTIDNVGGTVTATADTLIGPIPGVTGDGTLVQFEFAALAPGTSDLSFANEILLDSSLNEIANATFQNGSVTVAGASSVPEPSTILYTLAGLFLLGAILRFSRPRRAFAATGRAPWDPRAWILTGTPSGASFRQRAV